MSDFGMAMCVIFLIENLITIFQMLSRFVMPYFNLVAHPGFGQITRFVSSTIKLEK